eukprot:3686229-Alexandrium_andersonii.AAC.1
MHDVHVGTSKCCRPAPPGSAACSFSGDPSRPSASPLPTKPETKSDMSGRREITESRFQEIERRLGA